MCLCSVVLESLWLISFLCFLCPSHFNLSEFTVILSKVKMVKCNIVCLIFQNSPHWTLVIHTIIKSFIPNIFKPKASKGFSWECFNWLILEVTSLSVLDIYKCLFHLWFCFSVYDFFILKNLFINLFTTSFPFCLFWVSSFSVKISLTDFSLSSFETTFSPVEEPSAFTFSIEYFLKILEK